MLIHGSLTVIAHIWSIHEQMQFREELAIWAMHRRTKVSISFSSLRVELEMLRT